MKPCCPALPSSCRAAGRGGCFPLAPVLLGEVPGSLTPTGCPTWSPWSSQPCLALTRASQPDVRGPLCGGLHMSAQDPTEILGPVLTPKGAQALGERGGEQLGT